MRFHLIGLPHTETTFNYLACAYTQKLIKFSNMMTSLGHEVFLYASNNNDANCTELIPCALDPLLPSDDYVSFPFDGGKKWKDMQRKIIFELDKRIQPKDFICVSAGRLHAPIAKAFPNNITVEYGIGYGGTFAKYRVFESYAWMHMVYGNQHQDVHQVDGNFYDEVISNAFEVEDFPFQDKKEDYYLFMGRKTDRKGYKIAIDVCKHLGKKLVLVGPGFGTITDKKQRGELMGKAIAVFCPTLYIEPFGGVAVEAQMCGTPVITTDWGAFTETVEHGISGYRCRTFKDFYIAANNVKFLDPYVIRQRAIDLFSTDSIAKAYNDYFERLLTLWDKGWYSL